MGATLPEAHTRSMYSLDFARLDIRILLVSVEFPAKIFDIWENLSFGRELEQTIEEKKATERKRDFGIWYFSFVLRTSRQCNRRSENLTLR